MKRVTPDLIDVLAIIAFAERMLLRAGHVDQSRQMLKRIYHLCEEYI